MNRATNRAAAWLETQLASRPVINEAARVEAGEGDAMNLAVPLRHRTWSLLLKRILPMSDEKKVQLDRFGAEFFALCDGERTIENIIDIYMDRWDLSFFEARALVFSYLRSLMRYSIIALITPPGAELPHPPAKK